MKKTSKSKSSLAASLGISRSTLYQWRAAGAPIERGEGAILEWAMNENKRGNESDDMRAAKLAVLRETERRLKIANDAKSETTLSRETVTRDFSEAIGALFAGLDYLPQDLQPLPDETSARVMMTVERMKNQLRFAFAKLGGDAEAEAEAVKHGEAAYKASVQRAVNHRAWAESVAHEYDSFRDWQKEVHKIGSEKRAEWCRLRAAAGLPVPNATDDELRQHPGLSRA